MRNGTLPRHGRTTRVLHFANALVVSVLLVSGLALGDVLPERIVAAFGGHLRMNATHRVLGLAFAIALVVLAVVLPRRVLRLIRDIGHFRRADWRWPWRFLGFYASRGARNAPFHDGRFDPAQRLVFIGILLTVAALSTTGVYLYFWTPSFPFGQRLLACAIRVHIAAAWMLIACLCLHIVAGSGLPRTHRGLVKAMFGNGQVPVALARTLWPDWTDRSKATKSKADPPNNPVHRAR